VRETDPTHTVIMIQMENEVGLLGDSRDRCKEANEAFAAAVPKELMDYLQKNKGTLLPETRKLWDASGDKTSGTWEEVFGKGTGADEAFMAWHYARYMNRVTELGKKEYPIPVYVNAWLVQPQDKQPGDYPSGGPQAHNHDFWRAGAPQIDILAPDIYLTNFAEIATMYSRNGNPLFIPETRGDAANAFYAIGQLNAQMFSPFGIERQVSADGTSDQWHDESRDDDTRHGLPKGAVGELRVRPRHGPRLGSRAAGGGCSRSRSGQVRRGSASSGRWRRWPRRSGGRQWLRHNHSDGSRRLLGSRSQPEHQVLIDQRGNPHGQPGRGGGRQVRERRMGGGTPPGGR
jgi:hypothetical protein